MQTADQFRNFIESEVLKIIKDLSHREDSKPERLEQMAALTLDLIKPGMSLEALYQNAVKLDDMHPELAPVVFNLMKEYEQKYEQRALDQVSSYVKSGKFDEAQNLVKKVLQFKIDS